MSEQNQSFLSKLNPFSKTFKKVENVSAEAEKQSQIINNSVGVDNAGLEKSGLDYWLKGSAAGAQGEPRRAAGAGGAGGGCGACGGAETFFFCAILYSKNPNILPRQARGKHRKS